MIDEVTDVAALQQALKEEIAKRIQLEDECDLLAVENVRLNEEVAQLKSKLHGSIQHIVPLAGESDRVSTAVVWTSDGGDEDYPNTETMCIMNACNGKNVLSVSFCYNGDDEIEKIAAGGADNSLNIYDLTGSKISTYVLSAPVLSIDSYGEYLACSLMDGAHAVVNHLKLFLPQCLIRNICVGEFDFTCRRRCPTIQRPFETCSMHPVESRRPTSSCCKCRQIAELI